MVTHFFKPTVYAWTTAGSIFLLGNTILSGLGKEQYMLPFSFIWIIITVIMSLVLEFAYIMIDKGDLN
jgi:hypothetical protein